MNFAKTLQDLEKCCYFPSSFLWKNKFPFIPAKHVKWHVINVFAHHYLQCNTFLREEQFTQVTKCRESLTLIPLVLSH